jgi:hypothetical protein
VADHQEEIINESITATQEEKLRTDLFGLVTTWQDTNFTVLTHKEGKDQYKLSELGKV